MRFIIKTLGDQTLMKQVKNCCCSNYFSSYEDSDTIPQFDSRFQILRDGDLIDKTCFILLNRAKVLLHLVNFVI